MFTEPDLDKKLVPLRNGIVDGAVASAMGVVDAEIDRLRKLREKALVGDLIGDVLPEPTTTSSLQLPRDFDPDPGSEVDPLENLDVLPDDEAFSEVSEKLFNHTRAQAAAATIPVGVAAIQVTRYSTG